MELAPKHPGAHHYSIHAVEASPNPDRAVPSADVLGTLMPGASHLVHRPSHIYVRVGRYRDATEANLRAIAADEDYLTQCRVQEIYPAAYYPHNVHFLTASLAMEGRSAEMIEAAKKVGHLHGDDRMHQPGFGFPHLLRSIPLFTDVRFGRWDQVLAAPRPEHSAFQTAVWHYARGLAYVAQGKLTEAGRELAALRRQAASPELQELKIFDLNSLGAIALIGVDVLEGELQAARKRYPQAIAALRRAVSREDALLYSEPPDWPIPPRHNLGAVLLAAGQAREAEGVFREDLTRHRNNGSRRRARTRRTRGRRFARLGRKPISRFRRRRFHRQGPAPQGGAATGGCASRLAPEVLRLLPGYASTSMMMRPPMSVSFL